MPVIDHRGPEFATLGRRVLEGMKRIVRTKAGSVVIYPASGTGAWEAALVNTLSPGDRVLMPETGHFTLLWRRLAQRIGLDPVVVPSSWRRGVEPETLAQALAEHPEAKAVCIVQNETSTGCATIVPEMRAAMDAAGSEALLLVDTISSLCSMDMRMDEWGVDVVIAGSQKGLMLPPGLSFNCIGPKARAAHGRATLPRSYWDWSEMFATNEQGYFPYTPATNLLYGLAEAIDMLEERGLERVFARHDRHAEATRAAVATWGREVVCEEPRHHSSSLTAVMMPGGTGADAFRKRVLGDFNMSLGGGLSKLADQVFRIGHLGDFNDLTLIGTLGGVEMGLSRAGIAHRPGGVQAATDFLAGVELPPAILAAAEPPKREKV